MAIAIKQIPVLKGKTASTFIKKAEDTASKKHTVDFSKQASEARDIFAKAKL